VTDAFGGHGGIAQYNRDFLAALAANEAVGEILVLPRLGHTQDDEASAGVLQRRSVMNRFAYAARAFAEAARLKPDVVFSGHLYHGGLALALARIHGARLVSQLHGTEIWKPVSRLHLLPLERSDIVLCVSRDTRARYEMQARKSQNALVVANTVRPEFTPGDTNAARKGLGLSDEYVLLTVARLDTREGYKGHDRVISALPHLAGPNGRDIVYMIAGNGNDRPRLERLAADLGVTKQVRFLGKVPFEALPDSYRAADLFVLPSTGEGFGIVFLEAMACGTPALGLAAGGAPDALGDGELGILVDAQADFPSALQAAIQLTDGNREELSSIIQERFGQTAFRRRVNQAIEMLR
jgi:phosphatidyl-myo-inositol dimannoside synthase